MLTHANTSPHCKRHTDTCIHTHKQPVTRVWLTGYIYCIKVYSPWKYLDPWNLPGADFTKGLKSRFRLKSKTLVLNFVKKLLSLWS